MSQSTNKPYRDKLEKLIEEGEKLMLDTHDRRLYDEVKDSVDKLKVKLFKAKIADEGVN